MIIGGLGTLLQYGDGATPEVFTTVNQRVTVGFPALAMGTKDNTNLDSTVKTAAPTILDPGTLGLSLQYDPADVTQQHLTTLMFAKTVVNWRIVLPDAALLANRSRWDFPGFVQEFKPTDADQENNNINADVTLGVTGQPQFTPRTGS